MPISGVMSPSAKPAFIADEALAASSAAPGEDVPVAAAMSNASTTGPVRMKFPIIAIRSDLWPTIKLRTQAANCQRNSICNVEEDRFDHKKWPRVFIWRRERAPEFF